MNQRKLNYNYQDKLKSNRLITSFLSLKEIKPWSKFFEDKEAIEFLPRLGSETNLEWSKLWIERQINRYKEQTFGLQALIHQETGEFIGQCGLLLQEVDGIKELEVGYHIFKKHWGNGYATEAAKLFMDFASEKKLSDSIISIIDVGNVKSQRVAEKNGLTLDKKTHWFDYEVFIYRKMLTLS